MSGQVKLLIEREAVRDIYETLWRAALDLSAGKSDRAARAERALDAFMGAMRLSGIRISNGSGKAGVNKLLSEYELRTRNRVQSREPMYSPTEEDKRILEASAKVRNEI